MRVQAWQTWIVLRSFESFAFQLLNFWKHFLFRNWSALLIETEPWRTSYILILYCFLGLKCTCFIDAFFACMAFVCICRMCLRSLFSLIFSSPQGHPALRKDHRHPTVAGGHHLSHVTNSPGLQVGVFWDAGPFLQPCSSCEWNQRPWFSWSQAASGKILEFRRVQRAFRTHHASTANRSAPYQLYTGISCILVAREMICWKLDMI